MFPTVCYLYHIITYDSYTNWSKVRWAAFVNNLLAMQVKRTLHYWSLSQYWIKSYSFFNLDFMSSAYSNSPYWSHSQIMVLQGFSGDAHGKEPLCQHRRHKRCVFDIWVRKIPRRRTWQLTPVFLPGESHKQRNLGGYIP